MILFWLLCLLTTLEFGTRRSTPGADSSIVIRRGSVTVDGPISLIKGILDINGPKNDIRKAKPDGTLHSMHDVDGRRMIHRKLDKPPQPKPTPRPKPKESTKTVPVKAPVACKSKPDGSLHRDHDVDGRRLIHRRLNNGYAKSTAASKARAASPPRRTPTRRPVSPTQDRATHGTDRSTSRTQSNRHASHRHGSTRVLANMSTRRQRSIDKRKRSRANETPRRDSRAHEEKRPRREITSRRRADDSRRPNGVRERHRSGDKSRHQSGRHRRRSSTKGKSRARSGNSEDSVGGPRYVSSPRESHERAIVEPDSGSGAGGGGFDVGSLVKNALQKSGDLIMRPDCQKCVLMFLAKTAGGPFTPFLQAANLASYGLNFLNTLKGGEAGATDVLGLATNFWRSINGG